MAKKLKCKQLFLKDYLLLNRRGTCSKLFHLYSLSIVNSICQNTYLRHYWRIPGYLFR